jgi:hypothetical protein
MSGEDKVIGERLSRAAIVYDSITKATQRLDQAKALAVKDSVAGKLAGEATDMADFYIRAKYLSALDTITSWVACQAQMMNRMAAILEQDAKP